MNTHTEQWIAALRSGEFRQITETYYKHSWFRRDGHCALGVGFELYRQATGIDVWSKNLRWKDNIEPIMRWLGVDCDTALGVVWRNDYLRWDFEQIADWIETHQRGLDAKRLEFEFEKDLKELLAGTVFAEDPEPCAV